MRKIILAQFIILLCGTIFAWVNFSIELVNWLNLKSCTLFGCSASSQNPFLSPCFGGAVFFSLALILSILLIKKYKN